MRSKEEWFYRLHKCIKFYMNTNIQTNIPIDQIDIEYNQSWNMFIKTYLENYNFLSSDNTDYFCLINTFISRCTKDFNIKNYLKKKIQHELKHLKLPSYIQWIDLTNIHIDNQYPYIKNFRKLWFNHNGLWISINLIYQENISIEFQVKINFIHKQFIYLRKIIQTILIITV